MIYKERRFVGCGAEAKRGYEAVSSGGFVCECVIVLVLVLCWLEQRAVCVSVGVTEERAGARMVRHGVWWWACLGSLLVLVLGGWRVRKNGPCWVYMIINAGVVALLVS